MFPLCVWHRPSVVPFLPCSLPFSADPRPDCGLLLLLLLQRTRRRRQTERERREARDAEGSGKGWAKAPDGWPPTDRRTDPDVSPSDKRKTTTTAAVKDCRKQDRARDIAGH